MVGGVVGGVFRYILGWVLFFCIIGGLFMLCMGNCGNICGCLEDMLGGIFKGPLEWIENAGKSVGDFFGNAFKSAGDFVQDRFSELAQTAQGVGDTIVHGTEDA